MGATWTASAQAFYTGGIQRGTAGAPITTAALTEFGIGYDQQATGHVWDFNGNGKGAVHYVGIWNRVLSAEEIGTLEADPYAFLIPAEGEMPALRSTAAPTVPAAGWQQQTRIASRIAQSIPDAANRLLGTVVDCGCFRYACNNRTDGYCQFYRHLRFTACIHCVAARRQRSRLPNRLLQVVC